MAYPEPEDPEAAPTEKARLASLRKTKLLDTGPSGAFDSITRTAAEAFGCPVSFVSLIDENRQWFKSHYGTDLRESPRSWSLCSVTIQEDEHLVIPDASLDERFANSGLVKGEPRIRFYAGAVIRSEDGHPIGALCVIDQQPRAADEIDIRLLVNLAATVSEMVKQHQRLIEAEEIRDLLVDINDASPIGMVIFDQDDRLVTHNKFYEQLYKLNAPAFTRGNPYDQLIRYGIEKGQYPEAKGQEEEWLRARIESHGQRVNSLVQQLPDNRWVKIEERRTQKGFNVGYRVDITELKENQDRLEALANELTEQLRRVEAADMAKKQFLASVSHDLRTPLNAILGFSELISTEMHGPIGDERYLDYIRDIEHSAKLLLSIVDDILDMARLSSGQVNLAEEKVALRPSIHAALKIIMQKRNLGDNAPEVIVGDFPNETMIGDEQALRQIILNLISNAVKFTPAGEKVSIYGVWRPDRFTDIVVEDTGIGIDQKDLRTIMEPFQRVGNVMTRPSTGSGLGLSIVRALVEGMKGEIQMESTLGKGTKVTVTLPCC